MTPLAKEILRLIDDWHKASVSDEPLDEVWQKKWRVREIIRKVCEETQ